MFSNMSQKWEEYVIFELLGFACDVSCVCPEDGKAFDDAKAFFLFYWHFGVGKSFDFFIGFWFSGKVLIFDGDFGFGRNTFDFFLIN